MHLRHSLLAASIMQSPQHRTTEDVHVKLYDMMGKNITHSFWLFCTQLVSQFTLISLVVSNSLCHIPVSCLPDVDARNMPWLIASFKPQHIWEALFRCKSFLLLGYSLTFLCRCSCLMCCLLDICHRLLDRVKCVEKKHVLMTDDSCSLVNKMCILKQLLHL